MVKNLETLRVHYDYTVRDNADGSIVQFFYGEGFHGFCLNSRFAVCLVFLLSCLPFRKT